MINDAQTLAALLPHSGDFVEVATLVRDGVVESRHRGIAVVTAPDGAILGQKGSAKRLIYPRSAVKPLQVVAMLRAGLKVGNDLLAIAAASHYATAEHQRLVSELLASAGLDESALQCPTAWPNSPTARAAALADGPTKLAFNCSGKHAGFLAASVSASWPVDTYLEISHPIQQSVMQVLEDYSGERVLKSTIDGCGAPLHMMTVAGLARAFGQLQLRADSLVAAMLEYPWAVGDKNTPDAAFLRAGFVSKLGAEGVFAVGTASGHGVAVKIEDGSLRAAPLVALKLLQEHGLIDLDAAQKLAAELAVPVLGGGAVIGQLLAV